MGRGGGQRVVGEGEGEGVRLPQKAKQACESGAHLGGDLQPSSGGGAQVQHRVTFLEERKAAIELHQLVGGTRAVPLLLGEVVEPAGGK